MKPKLFIVTGNAMKFKELSASLNNFFDCEQKDWNETEIQGTSEEILTHKVSLAYEKFKQPVLVDDGSFHFDELGGFPGPFIKYFIKCMPVYDMGVKFAGTRAKIVCWLGIAFEANEIVIAEGSVCGTIVKPSINDDQNRFFDLIFQADGTDRPMIEYSVEEKNTFSHRGQAMKSLLEILKNKNKNV